MFFGYNGPPLSLFTIEMANIWQIRGALQGAVESAHKFYSILFYIAISTFELLLIHF